MNFMKNLIFIFCLTISLSSCFAIDKIESESKPIDHSIWNNLLNKHVDEKGLVNYRGFIADSLLLNKYLSLVSDNHPNDKNWQANEQLAYWINAYNAFTIRLIIRNYPTKSIKDIAGAIPFINSSWDIKFINIETQIYDLNNIEHGIIREHFNEPKIHFALVCAAVACPSLRNEAYLPEKLQPQLTEQAKKFINNPEKNKISANELELSKIFMWYKGDFTHQTSLIDFINLYSETKAENKASIKYLDYNWSLNEQ
jgi:hypothetical protein